MSFWPLFASCAASASTSLGAAINIIVLIYLHRLDMGGSWRVYRISIAIGAIIGISTCFHWEVLMVVQVFVADTYAMVVYGPVLLLPQWARDAVFAAGAAHIYLMWQLIPAQSILQFFSLHRSHYSLTKRLTLAYLCVLILVASSFNSCLEYIPTTGYADELREIGKHAHNLTNTDSFAVYGLPLFYTGENEGRNMLFTTAVEICPSYIASYLVFGYCFYRVYRMVHTLSEGVTISARSKSMHSTLLQLQFAQGSIPLLCTGLIILVSLVCVSIGLNIGPWASLISLGLWSFSTVQGSMYLLYLLRVSRSRVTTIHRKNNSSNSKSNQKH